jgi:cytidylate kinase
MGRKLVALSGPRGCGKSTIASILVQNHGYERIAFSDVLREIAVLAGIEYANDRVYLSELGEVLREYDSHFLLKAVDKRISDSKSDIVIEDIRFQSELDYCREREIQTIYLDVSRDEQLRRVQKREGCNFKEAEKWIDLSDETYLNSNSGWNLILQSEGDFRDVVDLITKNSTEINTSLDGKHSP